MKYTLKVRVEDGFFRKENYEFMETIEADNPREAFKKAKQLCNDASGFFSPKWKIKEITAVEE